MCGGGGGWKSEPSGTESAGSGGILPEKDNPTDIKTADSNKTCLINQKTSLENTDLDVLNEVNVGDVFPVKIRDRRPCVVDYDDQIIGSILESLGELILDCSEKGYRYRAEILEIEGRHCEVQVINRCFIDEEVMLASPDPDVLDTVAKNDVLDVVVSEGSLCVINDSERIIGSIAKPWTKILIQCIESGVKYKATVVSINGGDCRINIQNTSSNG